MYGFPMREYSKLVARKIGPVEIIEKINPNAYWLLPSHIKTSDVFDDKHLVPSIGDDVNSMKNSLQHREDNVDQVGYNFIKKTREDRGVLTNESFG